MPHLRSKLSDRSIVTPILTSDDPQNICTVTTAQSVFLTIISKVAEKCVSEQLFSFLNNGPFNLHPMQFGFRAHHSVESANCFFLEKVRAMVDKGGVWAVFLDLPKDFDTVTIRSLLQNCLLLTSHP